MEKLFRWVVAIYVCCVASAIGQQIGGGGSSFPSWLTTNASQQLTIGDKTLSTAALVVTAKNATNSTYTSPDANTIGFVANGFSAMGFASNNGMATLQIGGGGVSAFWSPSASMAIGSGSFGDVITANGDGSTTIARQLSSPRGIVATGSAPGISGCSAGTQTGGAFAGTFTSGTTGACTVTLTFALTAPTGWNCALNNQTTANLYRQSGGSATTAVMTGTTNSGDVVSYTCTAF